MAPSLDLHNGSDADQNVKLGALGKTKSGKKLKIRTYPQFENLEQERLYRKQHLAAAFRVFADRGFDEGVAGKYERCLESSDLFELTLLCETC